MYWYLKVLKNFKNFSGRARRREFWTFAFVHFFFVYVIATVAEFHRQDYHTSKEFSTFRDTLVAIYFYPLLLPWIALAVRRLHDINLSGWMLLFCLLPCFYIPIVGVPFLFIAFLVDSSPDNKYGPNPKAVRL